MENKSIEKVVKVVTGPVGRSVVLCAVIIAAAALFPSFCPRRAYLKSNNFSSQAF